MDSTVPKINCNPISLTRFLTEKQTECKEKTSGSFTILLQALQTACKFIASKCKKAGIANLLGTAGGSENTTGDVQKKLDIISNDVCINVLEGSGQVCCLVSEENEKPIINEKYKNAKYVVAMDPLDGSSNIDANVSIGTIFGVWLRKSERGQPVIEADYMRDGSDIICGGYCVYGSSTMFVIALGGQVNGFTLDPSLGEFLLTHPDIRIPKRGKIYSLNEGNAQHWTEPMKEYVNEKKFGANPYSLRYVGSMVADVHRTFIYGGIFIYPADKKAKTGKLRIMYECFPMAFLTETAGGKAITGGRRILDLHVKGIHDRSGVILGSAEDVDECGAYYKKHNITD